MTTQQGQQMIVTQVPRPVPHHVIVNQQSIATSTNVIQSNPQISSNTIISHVNTGTVNSISQSQTVSQIQMHQMQQTHHQQQIPMRGKFNERKENQKLQKFHQHNDKNE